LTGGELKLYKVALCEDEKILSKTQEKICRDILEKFNIEYHITVFNNSEDFLALFLKEETHYDLVLLDIIMDGINGVELAREIRKYDTDVTIIFVTSSREYALDGYDVNAFHYLIKPLDSDVLERLITKDYQNKFQKSVLVFKSGAQSFRILIKDIISLETVGRRVGITLLDEIVYFPGKLSELLETLPKKDFVRCHQAYAINLRNTREIAKETAVSVTGKTTPISRAFKSAVQKAFLKNIRNI
jgi:DNA-binding LytR/AlgR family response regulator